MADDINFDRRTELEAALDVLEPQIRGLHDLAAVSISRDLKAAIDREVAARERRRNLIRAEIAEMDQANTAHDKLLADGYPNLNVVALEPALFDELQGENADLDAATAIFDTDRAATLTMTFSNPQSQTKE